MSERPRCETCDAEIPEGGEGCPEICPACIRKEKREEQQARKPYEPPVVERIGSMRNLLGKSGTVPDASQTHMTRP